PSCSCCPRRRASASSSARRAPTPAAIRSPTACSPTPAARPSVGSTGPAWRGPANGRSAASSPRPGACRSSSSTCPARPPTRRSAGRSASRPGRFTAWQARAGAASCCRASGIRSRWRAYPGVGPACTVAWRACEAPSAPRRPPPPREPSTCGRRRLRRAGRRDRDGSRPRWSRSRKRPSGVVRAGADREPRWGDAAALILLCGGGLVAWWGDLGSGLLWLAPMIAVAALTTAGTLGPRPAVVLTIVWLPGAILAAGLPAGTLAPAALDTTTASLRDGLQAMPTIGDATPIVQSWALAAVLLIAGVSISLAGLLWRRPGRIRGLLGFALLLVPLGGAIAMQQTADSSWQGAVVLVALTMRIARGRLLPIVAAASMVGAVALFGAQVAAPRAGWQPFGHHHSAPRFQELVTSQTYGPLGDRRTGAVMLDVTAPQPALWRMQVLEAFDNRRWLVARETSRLPEPAARRESIEVEVRGLRNHSVVSPGRPTAVHTKGGALVEPGDDFALTESPAEGHV